MASIKLLLRKNKKKANGEIPIYIRVIKDRKTKFISTGIAVLESQWDNKNQQVKNIKNKNRLNAYLAHKVAEAQAVALAMETKNKHVTVDRIKNKFIGKESCTFTSYFSKYLNHLKRNNKIGTWDKAKATFNKLQTYTNHADLRFIDIDLQFLNDYEQYLSDELGNSVNTIHSNLKIFRKLFNDAIREEIILPDQNPFSRYKLKWEKTQKEYLSEEELTRLEKLQLNKGSKIRLHRDMYVFSCYAGGLRISDVLQLKRKDYNGSHITAVIFKTEDIITIKLPSKAKEILEYYISVQDNNDDNNFIFPILDNNIDYDPTSLHRAISSATTYTNKNLNKIASKAEINKDISFHTSRHTWATRALRKGMRIEYVSKLMGHASIKTTQIYSKIVNAELDKAMDVFE